VLVKALLTSLLCPPNPAHVATISKCVRKRTDTNIRLFYNDPA
jgi:hypothetical protein